MLAVPQRKRSSRVLLQLPHSCVASNAGVILMLTVILRVTQYHPIHFSPSLTLHLADAALKYEGSYEFLSSWYHPSTVFSLITPA